MKKYENKEQAFCVMDCSFVATDSVFILFKKTGFNTILACLGGKVYRWLRGHKFFVSKIGGVTVLLMPTFCKFEKPFEKKI